MNPIVRIKSSWLHPHIEVRDAGEKGVGTFAKAPIAKGEIVIVQGGRIIDAKELDLPEYEPYGYHCFQVEHDFYICPFELARESADGVFDMNHSCEPTCGFQGQITCVALRDIVAGDEITFDYAMTDVGSLEEGWEGMVCACGTASCRKMITGEDWKSPVLQRRFNGFFSPYIAKLIEKSRSSDDLPT